MAGGSNRELTLYIESKKAVTSFYRQSGLPPSGAAVGTAPVPGTTETRGAVMDQAIADEPVFFLSDDQARCLAITEEMAKRRGYHLTVVDIGKAGRLERLVAERLKGVQLLPALVTPGGRRLEGPDSFTDERLCEVMPTDLKNTRAFTYIKIKGGDFEKIREALVAFREVKELHFLTGDWDVFVVLEFPPDPARKRHVLDFVTYQIRSIPDVMDTSTLVPEYTLTKFPT
jgi:DNA-binding Lrp family transcriptional regulator